MLSYLIPSSMPSQGLSQLELLGHPLRRADPVLLLAGTIQLPLGCWRRSMARRLLWTQRRKCVTLMCASCLPNCSMCVGKGLSSSATKSKHVH